MIRCLYCGGEIVPIVCDDEGNIHQEPGYEEEPWSGLQYRASHSAEDNPDCPIANWGYREDEFIGCGYDTLEELEASFSGEQPTENILLDMSQPCLKDSQEDAAYQRGRFHKRFMQETFKGAAQ